MSFAHYQELETLHATLYRHRENENQELQNLIADMRAALDRPGYDISRAELGRFNTRFDRMIELLMI